MARTDSGKTKARQLQSTALGVPGMAGGAVFDDGSVGGLAVPRAAACRQHAATTSKRSGAASDRRRPFRFLQWAVALALLLAPTALAAQGFWSSPPTLASNAYGGFSGVAVDAGGNAFAVWRDDVGVIRGARYTAVAGNWSCGAGRILTNQAVPGSDNAGSVASDPG